MARKCVVDTNHCYRLVVVWKNEDGSLEYEYRGVYDSLTPCKAQLTSVKYTHERNLRWAQEYGDPMPARNFYDAWYETGTITWDKVKD